MGKLFINALKMLIIPLILSSMINGVTRLGDIRNLGRTGLITLVYYFVTTGIAVATGLMITKILPFPIAENPPANLESLNGRDFSPVEIILSIIPENIIEAMAEMQILPVIVFSIFLGAMLSTMGEKSKPVTDFFQVMEEALMKMVHVIVLFSPIGIFGLVAGKMGDSGGGEALLEKLWDLRYYIRAVIAGLGVHSFLTLPVILLFFARRDPFRYIRGMTTALLTAFSTASSSATLPVTMDCAENENKISNRSASFVLPLGATINMDGTALYEAVAVMYIAAMYGFQPGFAEQILILFTATLAAIGAAGIPEAGLVTMILVLQAVHLPAEGIGLILAIDWFLDRIRTAVNVWGDAVGAAVVDRMTGETAGQDSD